eukprot:CAMPEP_0194385696 /NCGR_PEP_ID=MMETSP0174-20130528/82004_1 /TAXON_ID=216777 /ORGANISM="Proboscia alata, Strain PI-D3" /LENGTH=171 /DNA_ID=CAMNT_0039174107 /DNA_START=183 /DNA_END=695 /DNA_ORIENTATION=+
MPRTPLTNAPAKSNNYYVGPIKVAQLVHGRGLVTTQDVSAGECLFICPPTVCANVDDVYRMWSSKGEDQSDNSLETITENILVKSMRDALTSENYSVSQSFLALLADHDGWVKALPQDSLFNEAESLRTLLGNNLEPVTAENMSDDFLLKIIRRNAFGPDFYTYESVERKW